MELKGHTNPRLPWPCSEILLIFTFIPDNANQRWHNLPLYFPPDNFYESIRLALRDKTCLAILPWNLVFLKKTVLLKCLSNHLSLFHKGEIMVIVS